MKVLQPIRLHAHQITNTAPLFILQPLVHLILEPAYVVHDYMLKPARNHSLRFRVPARATPSPELSVVESGNN